jgi:hypothetical protein
MWACPSFAVALLGLYLPTAQALFEDEVGQYEWVVQQVGQPTALAYSAEAADKVFVASASGVVASMLLKDGTLQWRRTTPGQGSARLLRAGSRGLLSVTDRGLVQAWKGSTGDLTWQREYPDKVVDLFVVGPGPKQSVVVVRESEVEVRTTAGKHEWSVAAGSNGARFWAAAPTQSDAVVCAISARKQGAGAQAVQIDVNTGKVVKQTEVPVSFAQALETSKFLVVDAHLVLLAGGKITSQPLCGDGKGETFDMSKVKSTGDVPFQLMPWQNTPGVFAATNGATTAIFGISSKGIKHLRTFDGVAVVGPVYSVHDDETGQPVAVAIVGSEGTKIQLLDPASGNVQPAINAEGYTSKDHGPARLLLVRELSSGEHRTVISAADHSLAGVQGSKVNWVREEALASIRQASFYGRAAATAADKAPKQKDQGLAALIPAMTAQLSQLPGYAGELASKPAEIATAIGDYFASIGKEPRRTKPTLLPNAKAPTSAEELRGFGANKLILCVTRASKLFALEATTSEIVWHRYFATGAELLGDASGECADASQSGRCGLWVQTMPSTSAVYSELVVVTPRPSSPNEAAQKLLWIDPLTGTDLHVEAAPSSAGILSLMTLPGAHAQAKSVLPFLLIDAKKNVYALPSKKAEVTALLDDNKDRLFHFEVDRASQAVQGYAIAKTAEKHQLVRLWNIELGSVGERIVAAALPDHRDWEHVPVHIKGDASILYKYINANMLTVVSEDVTTSKTGNVTSLNLYVMDSVTGHVLHQSRIVGGATPVHLVACDNWVLMHYWNAKRTRFELTVVELFEAKTDDGPWNILFGGKSGHNDTSAHHLETPVPLQQTYIFPTGVTSLGVTATLKGITPRSVIMALTTDHLYRISKDMLNPRRPYTTSSGAVDKEKTNLPAQFAPTKDEPVPPYAPVMPLRPTDVMTYYNAIGQVDGIVSTPTSLESTSLVFSYGLDLFFTPVQTAKAYDVLSPGFNYTLLYASVGSVVAMLIVTNYWSQYRVLQDRWK